MREADRQGSAAAELTDGVRIGEGSGRHLYRFRAAAPIALSPDMPIRLACPPDEREYAGSIVSIEDFSVMVCVNDLHEASLPRARLMVDANFILKALRMRLEHCLQAPHLAGYLPRAICGLVPLPDATPPIAPSTVAGLNALQAAAVHACSRSRIHFVWGPPGTGKTRTLGRAVERLARSGQRVLVVSHSNVAVDTAMLSCLGAIGAEDALVTGGRVLRVGNPQDERLLANEHVLPSEVALRGDPALASEAHEIEASLGRARRNLQGGARTSDSVEDIEFLRRRRSAIRERLKTKEARIMSDAAVIATTSARVFIDDKFWIQPFDAVVVDEASMIGLASALGLSLRARQRLLVFGDFRQLPPVVLSTTDIAKNMLGRDTFSSTGITDQVDRGGTPQATTMLRVQYRMKDEIQDVVNGLAYNGRLVNGRRDTDATRVASALELVDCSSLNSHVLRDGPARSRSRCNIGSAVVTAAVAADAVDRGEKVVVITPYRAQVRLISAALAEIPRTKRPQVATVHRFQGSEAETVIIDLVEGAPMDRPSPLLAAGDDSPLRLINVAMSRARDRLVVIADRRYLTRSLSGRSPVNRALTAVASRGSIHWAEKLSLNDQISCQWGASFTAVATELVAQGGVVHMNLPFDDPTSDLRAMAESLSSSLASACVSGPPGVLKAFSDTGADLRFQHRESIPYVAGDAVIAIGGDSYGDRCLITRSASLGAEFRRLLTPDSVTARAG